MGANITPIAKNRGSTVLGVRIGLSVVSGYCCLGAPGSCGWEVGEEGAHCHAFNRCCLKAVSTQIQHDELLAPPLHRSSAAVTSVAAAEADEAGRGLEVLVVLTWGPLAFLLLDMLRLGFVRRDGRRVARPGRIVISARHYEDRDGL